MKQEIKELKEKISTLEEEKKELEEIQPKNLQDELKRELVLRLERNLSLSRLEELENFEKLTNKNYMF